MTPYTPYGYLLARTLLLAHEFVAERAGVLYVDGHRFAWEAPGRSEEAMNPRDRDLIPYPEQRISGGLRVRRTVGREGIDRQQGLIEIRRSHGVFVRER